MLACGDQTLRAENPAQVAGFISEWWPASNRNRGRIEIGIPEGSNRSRGANGCNLARYRDPFEAGLNEAAAALAAIYGR